MKRTHLVAAGAIALAGVLASHASAQTPALSLNFTQGSSGEPDAAGLLGAAVGLAKAADGIANNGVIPQVRYQSNQINVVLDPSVVPGLAEALAPANPAQLHPGMRGTSPSGYPVVFPTSGTFTSGFGMRWGAMHNGIDVANPVGTPIYSIMDGTVISSGPAQGFGNWIRIKHDDGSVSVYGHMSANSLLVSEGQRVTAGQQIASIGNEGHSTGPHLHFEIHPDGSTPADPQAWFAAAGIPF
ncbi:peptidoglycan DD-metalloendopeptidase family protein [Corynebacterium lizhenjunii]|uniref:Peptidoglycan DD-metalloendopeptidase family protein n=1 Tax=Corynebacterium lizhenjunii TaxID=2709394 RepID=A0A7T0KGJ0_9CORY|nr:M23 family metallopeptidase [Corynebacterium lizhenjunii]QPK79780.1 peptidoglycan DD-metalloendopeptidase family protein [Corynebacterium lizhenjunii]